MKAMVKGFELSVSVNATIKGSFDIDENENRNYNENDTRSRSNKTKVNDMDLGVNASIIIKMDECEGDIDLKELGDLVKTSLSDEIGRQIKEQLTQDKQDEKPVDEPVQDNTPKPEKVWYPETPTTPFSAEDDSELY